MDKQRKVVSMDGLVGTMAIYTELHSSMISLGFYVHTHTYLGISQARVE